LLSQPVAVVVDQERRQAKSVFSVVAFLLAINDSNSRTNERITTITT